MVPPSPHVDAPPEAGRLLANWGWARHARVVGYCLALVFVLVAFGLRRLLPLAQEHTSLLFILAAILAAWCGGLGPGLFASGVGLMLGGYLFTAPDGAMGARTGVEWAYLLTYSIETGLALGLVEALRRARRRAERYYLLAQSRGQELRNTIAEVSEAEAKLRELAAAVESARDAIVITTLKGKVKSWNGGTQNLLGYTAAEMLGQSVRRLIPEERQAEYEVLLHRLCQGESVGTFDTSLRGKDGRRLQISLSLSPVRDASGNIISISAIGRDLTELRRAAAALQESEHRFRALADAAPLMVWMTDTAQRRTWVNRSWLSFTGRTLNQELGDGWADSIHAEDRPLCLQRFGAAIEQRQPLTLEYRLRRHDGQYRWIFDQAVPHFAADGTFLGYLGSGMDVTERKQAEEALGHKFEQLRTTQLALREQNEQLAASRRALELERSRYRELFDSAPVGYIITTREGTIQEVNHAAAALMEELPDFLVGFPLARLLAREDRPAFFANVARLTARETAVIQNWEASIRPRGRPPITVSLSANLVLDGTGQLSGLRWLVRDISERKRAEQKILRLNSILEQRVRERTQALEAANRELEAFSYSVSHDLKAPLRSINGFSKALLEEYGHKLDDQGLKYLNYAHQAALRMSRLVDDLIKLSRASRGELHRQNIDLSQLAGSVLADLQRREPDRAIDLQIAPGLVARGDEGLLRIAMENLLGNAWKFTTGKPRPTIEVGATESDGVHWFFVRDNGAGFNMANADRLFGVFQRLHAQDEFPGTGIGLATVRRIFNRHGGEVRAEAKINEGATFYFRLPDGNGSVANSPVLMAAPAT